MPDVESQASALGWVPEEKFKGDPKKWVDAETFVRRGEEIMPILKKANEGLRGEVTTLRGEMTKTQQLLQAATESLLEFQKYHEEDSKRQYERALEKLKGDKREALRDNDVDAVVEIDEAISQLRQQETVKPAPKAAEKPAQPDNTKDPGFQQWVNENSDWYGVDQKKTAYATGAAQYLRAMEPTLTGKAFLDRVTEEVNEKFGGRQQQAADRVEGSRGGSGRDGGGKSYADLPPEAKASCDRFGARLIGEGKAYKTQAEWRKQYVNDYFGGER
jgi:hypothetical protein